VNQQAVKPFALVSYGDIRSPRERRNEGEGLTRIHRVVLRGSRQVTHHAPPRTSHSIAGTGLSASSMPSASTSERTCQLAGPGEWAGLQRPLHTPPVREVERRGRAEVRAVSIPHLIEARTGRRDAAED